MKKPFYLQKGNIYALPVLHHNMETAKEAHLLFHYLKPACIAVELPDTLSLQFLHGCSRLPDISAISTETSTHEKLFYLIEPCDALFESIRCALEAHIPAYCIDLDIDSYPEIRENIPDPYAIQRIGLKRYYEIYLNSNCFKVPEDEARELHMAKNLKELALRYDSVLFIGGMAHIQRILEAQDRSTFPFSHSKIRTSRELITPSEESLKHILGECGWISVNFETGRESSFKEPLDRQKLIYELYKKAGATSYNLRNTMKFARNYALISHQLLPDLFQILTSAKNCVDHNYAYETWLIATDYPFYKNVDNLPIKELSPEQVWGHSKWIRFHLRQPSRKAFASYERRKNCMKSKNYPPGIFSICSYPPEDALVENFGKFLKRKGVQILQEQGAHTVPFTSSIEDGIDVKETIHHFAEKKLYVKTNGRPPGRVGSIVMIFDEEADRYPWMTSWLGEHTQESDMAFYATSPQENVIGPGISKCEYGGFMMSYPPRRLLDVWHDPDYEECKTKAEVLLVAAIDYSIEPVIVYAAPRPPSGQMKSFARRFGKKIAYLPLGGLSPITIKKLRAFHVLDGHQRREIAKDYIF